MSTGTIRPSVGPVKALPPGRYGLPELLASEWTKLRSLRSTMWTLGITVVLGIGISAIATAETRAHWSSSQISGFDPTGTSLIGLFFGQLTIGVLGVLVMSGEYSSGTIRATFSAAPRRPLVLLAKALVFGVVSLVVAEVVAFASFFLGQALLSPPAIHATISSPGALRAVAGGGLYLCLIGLFALGISTIVRHSAGAISTFLGILLLVPVVIRALPSSLANRIEMFMPDHIGAAVVTFHMGQETLPPFVGLLVLFAYAAALLTVGGVLLVRRDA
ncbi:MAG: ABC transporter permease subunit [Acidimicrobiales bacterium]|jgi:ABC-type transport system involved in multi-copper enzyme maturation permease subunit